MKLYIYDHCPYCTRARLALARYGHAFETIVLANDDEATPVALIGAKQVPILQKPDGTHMGESLDIVRWAAAGKAFDDHARAEVQTWFEAVQTLANQLCMPRCVQLGLPEFAQTSAIAYYTRKKEEFIGDFAAHLANTPDYLAQLSPHLAQLENWLASGGAGCLNGNNFGLEDVLVFPLLRNLTMVRGLVLPPAVAQYTAHLAAAHHIPLFGDRAV